MPNPDAESVSHWIRQMEDVYGLGEDGVGAICEATGEKYDTICWSLDGLFVKPEGDECELFWTEADAWRAWILGFRFYLRNRHGRFHWRMRPEIRRVRRPIGDLFYVAARVFVERAQPPFVMPAA